MGIGLKINCPNCGGVLEFPAEEEFLQCGYCSVNLVVYVNKAITSLYYEPVVKENIALSIVKEELKEKNLLIKNELNGKLCFFPFLRYEEKITLFPLFTPYPFFFRDFYLYHQKPLIFNENELRLKGEVIEISDEILEKVGDEKNCKIARIYYIPFYVFEIDKEKEMNIYVDAVYGKIFWDNLPISIQRKESLKTEIKLILFSILSTIVSFLLPSVIASMAAELLLIISALILFGRGNE